MRLSALLVIRSSAWLCLFAFPCIHLSLGIRIQLSGLSFILLNLLRVTRPNELRRDTGTDRGLNEAEGNTLTRLYVRKLPLPTLSISPRHDMGSHVSAGNIPDHRRKCGTFGRHVDSDALTVNEYFEGVHA